MLRHDKFSVIALLGLLGITSLEQLLKKSNWRKLRVAQDFCAVVYMVKKEKVLLLLRLIM